MSKEIVLDESQKEAIDFISKRIKNGELETKLSGCAGSGKSLILSRLADDFPRFAVCAFTGKAASVLKDRGIDRSSTIHRIIFRPIEDEDGNMRFIPKTKKEIYEEYDGFLIDESSMISAEIYKPLAKLKLPIVFVGDHHQLEPVGTNINLMKNPDICLEKIHRNAGEVAHFAEWIRLGNDINDFKSSGNVKICNQLDDNDLLKVDQSICAFNKFRVSMNKRIRKIMGFGDEVQKGDRIICLRNNWNIGVYNGMQGVVKSVDYKKNKIKFETDNATFNVRYNPEQFNQEKVLESDDHDICPFDYSYNLTTHKVQGSEYSSVLVFEQKCQHWDHRRWSYTAASRAKKNVIWIKS